MENSPECPSSDALRDLQAAVEKVLLSPGDGLESILVLAVAHGPEGTVKSRMILAPPPEMQGGCSRCCATTSLCPLRNGQPGLLEPEMIPAPFGR